MTQVSVPNRARELTPRMKQIVALLTTDHTCKEAADKLGLKIRGVEKHRERIYDRLRIRSISRLTHWAFDQGLIDNLYEA